MSENSYYEEKKRLKDTTNPWERVISNVEISSSGYIGGADVSRMRQAMISRKQTSLKEVDLRKIHFDYH